MVWFRSRKTQKSKFTSSIPSAKNFWYVKLGENVARGELNIINKHLLGLEKNVVIAEFVAKKCRYNRVEIHGRDRKGAGTGKKCRYNRNVARSEVARGDFNCKRKSISQVLYTSVRNTFLSVNLKFS